MPVPTSKRLSFFHEKYRLQIWAAMAVHSMTLAHGIFVGWLSPIVSLLSSSETPLAFTISVAEISWMGSMYGVGSLTGCFAYGFLPDRIGRKWCLILLALPHMVSWVLAYSAQNVYYIYLARFLGGVTGGANNVVIPLYISEIADSSIRGALTTLSMLLMSIGILIGFVLASQLNYFLLPCLAVIIPILFIFAVCSLPETMQYLLKKEDPKGAEKSYLFYNNLRDKDTLSSPYAPHRDSGFDEFRAALLKGNEGFRVTVDDFVNKRTLKIFLTCFVLIMLNQCSGSFALITYMSSIFSSTGITMDPDMATIIVGVVQIFGTGFGSFLVDRCGRRPLLLVSAGAMAAGLASYGLFAQFASLSVLITSSWVPVAVMMFVIFTSSLGVVALFFVLIVELLPAKIRGPGTTMCIIVYSALLIGTLKVFPIILDNLGVSVTMYICSSACVLGLIYLGLLLPETKGKSLIQD